MEKLERNYDITVRLVHFPLHPETPADGASLEDLFAGRDIDLDAMYAQMKSLMDEENLPYAKRTHTFNSRLAQELGKWADTQPNANDFHDAMYRAYFVDTLNVGDPAVLLNIVDRLNMDTEAASTVLNDRTFSPAVDSDWAKSRQYGITGVPTFVAAMRGVVGAQPYEVIERLLTQAGAIPKSH